MDREITIVPAEPVLQAVVTAKPPGEGHSWQCSRPEGEEDRRSSDLSRQAVSQPLLDTSETFRIHN